NPRAPALNPRAPALNPRAAALNPPGAVALAARGGRGCTFRRPGTRPNLQPWTWPAPSRPARAAARVRVLPGSTNTRAGSGQFDHPMNAIESEAAMTIAVDNLAEWWSLAACQSVDPDLFFPMSTTNPSPD